MALREISAIVPCRPAQDHLCLKFLVYLHRRVHELLKQLETLESLGNLRQVGSIFCALPINGVTATARSLFVDPFAIFDRPSAELIRSRTKIVMLPLFDESSLRYRTSLLVGNVFQNPDEHRAVTISIRILANEFSPKLAYVTSMGGRYFCHSFVNVLLVLTRNIRHRHGRLVDLREKRSLIRFLLRSRRQIPNVMSSLIGFGS